MTYVDDHTYRMRILQDITDMIPDVMAKKEITPSQCGRAVEEATAVVRRRLPPSQFRAWVRAFTDRYPAFKPVLVQEAYLDDENGTWDKAMKDLAHGLIDQMLKEQRGY